MNRKENQETRKSYQTHFLFLFLFFKKQETVIKHILISGSKERTENKKQGTRMLPNRPQIILLLLSICTNDRNWLKYMNVVRIYVGPWSLFSWEFSIKVDMEKCFWGFF